MTKATTNNSNNPRKRGRKPKQLVRLIPIVPVEAISFVLSADAQNMMNKKTEESTKGNYKSKFNHFYDWIMERRPDLWKEDEQCVDWASVDNSVFPNFLADCMWKKGGGAKANSTMGNYRSALTATYLDVLNLTYNIIYIVYVYYIHS